MRSIMYTGTAPDNQGFLYVSENVTKLKAQLPAADNRNSLDLPSTITVPGIIPPAYFHPTWPWFPPFGPAGGGFGPDGGGGPKAVVGGAGA